MRSRVYETVGRPSVCLSVRPIIRPPYTAASGLLLSAVPAADINRAGMQQEISINSGGRRAPSSVVGAAGHGAQQQTRAVPR